MSPLRNLVAFCFLISILPMGCQKSEDWVKREEHYPDGTLKSSVNVKMLNGREVFVGEAKSFFPSGKPESVTEFVNGQRHGKHVEYFEDGRVRVSGTWEKGKQNGTWTETDKEGKTTTTQYEHGKRIG
jgi:antitoxin component YwqK of YwqJK toxin-antitoxin module